MEFKIDTKDTFTIIAPVADHINAILAGALLLKCQQIGQIGSNNYIIDLQYTKSIDEDAIEQLIALHEVIYSQNQSVVITGINSTIFAALKKHEQDLLINIAPKIEEAIDIISMEILERELLSEE